MAHEADQHRLIERLNHDRLFKLLLRLFLAEFLTLFLPALARSLNLSTPVFLDQELLDLTDPEKRIADVVARVEQRTQQAGVEARWLCLHIEVQARPQRSLGERMLNYYVQLRRREALPVIPIVLFLTRTPAQAAAIGVSQYTERIPGLPALTPLTFRYYSIRLPNLEGATYLRQGSLLAAALAALMKRPTGEGLAAYKLACLEPIARGTLSAPERALLTNLVYTYLRLSPEEDTSFERLLQEPPYQEVRQMQKTYFQELAERGRQAGLIEGRVEGLRVALQQLLALKFGPLPAPVQERLGRLADADRLTALLERAYTASSLEALLEEENEPGPST